MAKYKLRLAKPSDAKEIANLHYSIREQGAPGIFAMMGKPFLKKYYKIVLNDPNEVVICAENEKGQIVGFNSSTLDAKVLFRSSADGQSEEKKGSTGFRCIYFYPCKSEIDQTFIRPI